MGGIFYRHRAPPCKLEDVPKVGFEEIFDF
jgi:hypothetical protein